MVLRHMNSREAIPRRQVQQETKAFKVSSVWTRGSVHLFTLVTIVKEGSAKKV